MEKIEQLTEQSISSELWNAIIQSLALTTPFIKDLILTTLARRGIFIELHSSYLNSANKLVNEIGEKVMDVDLLNSKKWSAVLNRLGKIGCLFFANNSANSNNNRPNEEISESFLAISKMFPMGEITVFHKEIIYSLLQLNVPNVIQSFLDYYKLDINSTDPKAFLPSNVNDRDIPAWFSLLIQIRKGDDLYKASLVNASICLSQSPAKHQKSGCLAEMLKSGRLLMLLGTLAYSNNTMENTMKEEEGINELQLLRDAVKKIYPALYPVLNSNNSNSFASNFQSDKILRDMLLLLEKSSPFVIEKIPEISFHEPSVAKFAYQDTIDISYYLSKGQPVKAFQLFLNQPQGNYPPINVSFNLTQSIRSHKRSNSKYCMEYSVEKFTEQISNQQLFSIFGSLRD